MYTYSKWDLARILLHAWGWVYLWLQGVTRSLRKEGHIDEYKVSVGSTGEDCSIF